MLKNTVLVHYSKQDVLQDEVYPILQKKLNLKKFGIGEIEKLLNRTNQFVGIKKRCVQKGQIYRMMVEKFDGQEGIGKAYYEDSIVEVGGVPHSGVFNIVIYRTDHFYAKGAITDSKPTSSDVAEEVKYYLYNHHLVIELLYIERCSVFSLKRMMCIEKTPPLLKAELHLQESCTISKVSKWEFVKFTKDDRFRLTCTLCSGTGNVECNKCNGETTLPCNKCSSSGKLKCLKCKETGYTFYCHVCDGRGSIYEPSQTCGRCSGTGEYTWSNTCNRCGGIGKYRGTLKDCFGCNGTGRYSGSKECNSCEGSGFHRVGRDRECHYCHGRAKQVCEKCNGTALFICIKCSGSGRIDCFGCDATGKMTCPKCNATGTVACHLKSIKHASECEGECSDDDVVQLESGESKTILNRKATIVVDAWRTASSKRFCDAAREYNDLIYEKIINNEFAVLHEYVTRDKIAKEAEFEETKQKAEYHKVEASIDHASEGCMFAFYTHTNCKDTFRKAQVVEIEGESGKKTGVVSEVHSDHLNVRFKNREELSSSGVIQHKFVKSPFRCQRECISTLQNKNADVLAIKDVLCRLSTLEVPSKVNVKSYFNPNIAKTSGQKKAVDLAYSEPPILLLQGPPGTGKTTVIYEMIRQCISNPRSRVLMASQGNAAVDNVLAKLHKDQDLDEDILAVRLGGKDSFTIDEAKEYTFPVQFRQFQKDIRERTEDAYDKLQNSLTGLRETDTKVTGLIQLEEELEDKNRELATITSQFSEYINKKERLVQTISETNRLRIDLKNKIEASKKSIFKKMINGLLSVFNRDPASRMVKTDIRLSGLQKEQSSVNNIIKEIETNQRAVKAKLSTLSNRKETYPETVLRISEKGLGALREHQKAQSKILKRREDVFSLMKEWKDFVDTGQEALEQYLAKKANLVFSTCIGIHTTDLFNSIDYDLVIVDECSRATMMEIMVPLVRGKRFVLVGDHLQLPPTTSRNTMSMCRQANGQDGDGNHFDYLSCLKGIYCGRTCYYNISYFEQLFNNQRLSSDFKLRLDTQFRMHPDIAEFISSTFYGVDYPLQNGAGTQDNKLSLPSFPRQIHIISTIPYGDERYEKSRGYSKINPLEAEKTCEIITTIAQELSEPATVGVLSFYKAQVERIKSDLAKTKLDMSYIRELEIASLDSFQGKEKDIIIISFVRSVKSKRRANLDFVLDLHRLNVAMSRASKKLLIVGDIKTLESHSKKQSRRIDVIASLIDHVKRKGSVVEYWNSTKKTVRRHK